MTTVDVVYRFGRVPTEAAVLATARLREIYGIRRLEFREAEKTVCVEFDSTRLTEVIVHQLLRRAGLDVLDKVVLYTPPAPAEAAPAQS
jgi:ABC-type nitrate/sulfonate/bicarbonate transport system substrate-binding protein